MTTSASEQDKIYILNGPNLNLLGIREPDLYGHISLEDVIKKLLISANEYHVQLEHFQSNHEGALIDFINQQYIDFVKNPHINLGFIVNFGAYTHTSIALLDALSMFPKKNVLIYEVHLTNIFSRETFRQHSFVSKIANETIVGLGVHGYEVALFKILDAFKSFRNSDICTSLG